MENIKEKCPHCGAKIEHYYNHKCPYCRNFLHMTDENIKKIDNCEIKIDYVELEKNPYRAEYILICRGWTTPKMLYLEELNYDSFILSGDTSGKRVGYNLRIPLEVIYKYSYEEIIDYIYKCIPPELCNGYNEDIIISKILEKGKFIK